MCDAGVSVGIRIRPLNSRETAAGCTSDAWSVDNTTIWALAPTSMDAKQQSAVSSGYAFGCTS